MEARVTERRRHPRHIPLREISGKVKSTMDFQVVDISESGMQLETGVGLPPTSICELKLSVNGRQISVKAKVQRCRAELANTDGGCKVKFRSGLEFVKLDDGELDRIRQMILEHCNGEGVVAESAMPSSAGEPSMDTNFRV